jgi:hypothetical protein
MDTKHGDSKRDLSSDSFPFAVATPNTSTSHANVLVPPLSTSTLSRMSSITGGNNMESNLPREINEFQEGRIYCSGCSKPLSEDHLVPVYGEWECSRDYRRCIGPRGIDKMGIPSTFDLTSHVQDTLGCSLGFMYDIPLGVLERVVPHNMHMLWRHRYRELDLPIQRKPSFEALRKFNSSRNGLSRKQFDLLDSKYPFLVVQIRRGHEFIEHWPDESNVYLQGNTDILNTQHLQQLPPHILQRLVLNNQNLHKPTPSENQELDKKEVQIFSAEIESIKIWIALNGNMLDLNHVCLDRKHISSWNSDEYKLCKAALSNRPDFFSWYPVKIHRTGQNVDYIDYINVNLNDKLTFLGKIYRLSYISSFSPSSSASSSSSFMDDFEDKDSNSSSNINTKTNATSATLWTEVIDKNKSLLESSQTLSLVEQMKIFMIQEHSAKDASLSDIKNDYSGYEFPDMDGDADQDSDIEYDISKPHPDLDSETD